MTEPAVRGPDDVEIARGETRAAFANRAHIYAHILDVLSEELGEERAVELMRRAIRRRGEEVSGKYRRALEAGGLPEAGRVFCADSPCGGTLFEPAVEEQGDDRIVLRMSACPLLDAWRGAGLAPERCDLLCSIAAAVDEGTFEGAGLDLDFLDRLGRPGSTRCLLELRIPDAR